MNKFNARLNQGATMLSQSKHKTVRPKISPDLFGFFEAIQPSDAPPKDPDSLNLLFEWLNELPIEKRLFELVKASRRHSIELRHFRTAFEFWRRECRDASGASAQHGGQS
jgi:hypothetical protein